MPVVGGFVAGGNDDDDAAGHGELGGACRQRCGAVEILVGVAATVCEAIVAQRAVDHLRTQAVRPLEGRDPAVLFNGEVALPGGDIGGRHVIGLGQQVLGEWGRPDQPARVVTGQHAQDARAVPVLPMVGFGASDRLEGLVADLVVVVDEVPRRHHGQVLEGTVVTPVEAGVDHGDAHPLAEDVLVMQRWQADGGRLGQGAAVVEAGGPRRRWWQRSVPLRQGWPPPGMHRPHLAHAGQCPQALGLAGRGVDADGVEPARPRTDDEPEGFDLVDVVFV